MSPPDKLLNAAHAIRPYLSELLNAPIAQKVSEQLENFLAVSGSGQDVNSQILTVLTEYSPTREWLRLYIEENYPVEAILKVMRTYAPLPDNAHAVESPRYLCPVASCHQTWYRSDRNQPIPNCPIHDVQMVRDSKGH
ncbi:MAG: hypothetical protein QNJ46_18205 [Leptolyngbyaceae cyanobacterium MO_188.B28]|nr:hypothetical protein [Leptolyngbyaceae cyanobacterium MO_188.B28]